jgi:predicted DNA-binding transcriptional regulator YafY
MSDATTTSRVLRLLSLLQTRRAWQGPELAERVGVSPRTIRRDIDRLRELGYTISAERGSIGGYRLEAGSDLPPLLFSAEEAVALAIGLRAGAADGAVRDIADLTVSVIAKLEQVLPAAARAHVHAAQMAVSTTAPVRTRAVVDPEIFAALALACRDSEIVRFAYVASDGTQTSRRVEPIALVPAGGRWYLLAWDLGREEWRTFRLDRIAETAHTRVIVPRREVPGRDAAGFVQERLAPQATPRYSATVRIAAPHADVDDLLGPYTTGLIPDGTGHTLWSIHDDRLEILAGALTWLIWPFVITEGDELRTFVHDFASRLRP